MIAVTSSGPSSRPPPPRSPPRAPGSRSPGSAASAATGPAARPAPFAGARAVPPGGVEVRPAGLGVMDRRRRQEHQRLLLAQVHHGLRRPVDRVVAVLLTNGRLPARPRSAWTASPSRSAARASRASSTPRSAAKWLNVPTGITSSAGPAWCPWPTARRPAPSTAHRGRPGATGRAGRARRARSRSRRRAGRRPGPAPRSALSGLRPGRGRLLPGGRGRVVPVQGLHELLLGVVRQRGLQHRAAVGLQRLDELVRGHLAHDDQDR